MILEQFIHIIAFSTQKKWYESLGYILDEPMYNPTDKMANHKYELLVNVNDLPPVSKIEVTRVCDKCGKIDVVKWEKKHQHDLCYMCAREKPTNYSKCQECGKDLGHWNKEVKICRECWRNHNVGENHPSWKPEIPDEKRKLYAHRGTDKYKTWSLKIKERDNYMCKKCNASGVDMESHHIFSVKDYPDLIYDINNGICLCSSCHRIFHDFFRSRKSTPEQLIVFLKEYKL